MTRPPRDTSIDVAKFGREARHPSDEASHTPDVHAIVRPHIEAFNMIFEGGLLEKSVAAMEAREVRDNDGNVLRFWLDNVQVSKPMLSDREDSSLNRFLMPRECRERGISYRAKMIGTLMYSVNGGAERSEVRSLGLLPIMVGSSRCHLEDLSPAQLVERREESEEVGGYFIVNGIERIIRLLIANRRNHPIALFRPSLAKRGIQYSSYGMQIRCVRNDESSQTVYLHYLLNGAFMMRVHVRKAEYLIPLMLVLKALIETDDREIMEGILHGDTEDTFVSGRVEAMLRDFKKERLYTQRQCLAYLGERMKTVMGLGEGTTSEEIGREFLARYVLVHLPSNGDKFALFLAMMRRMYAVIGSKCAVDNADAPCNHEVLLGGQIYLNYLKEKLDDWLLAIKLSISIDMRRAASALASKGAAGAGMTATFENASFVQKAIGKAPSDVGRKMEYFLATGNLVSSTGLDLQQTSGYTIVAEKLNFMRYISHFRSIHRGAFFAELKTTAVRKLMPEAWGFMCPVHTPDGSPCGLLNHLSHECRLLTAGITMEEADDLTVVVLSLPNCQPHIRRSKYEAGRVPIMMDGRWIGNIHPVHVVGVARQLRAIKAKGGIPPMVEIVAVPTSDGGLYPGLFLFTGATRMMRPVYTVAGGDSSSAGEEQSVIYVGTFEQMYLDIAVKDEEVVPGLSEFVEISPTAIMSVVANLTPFPDFNQSPRNMYQCQMAKQSMATPLHNYPHRTDNKLYRLLTPQSPIVRTESHNRYGMDNFASGTNAVVAVISYTGYDMEDAMILNKSAFERGLKHGVVYKSEFYDISDREVRGEPRSHFFGFGHGGTTAAAARPGREAPTTVEVDGLPAVGQRVKSGDVLFSVFDESTGRTRVQRYKGFEDAYIDEVRLLGIDNSSHSSAVPLQKIHIKYRIPRNPVIGDKFSSRHGQKGVCSQKYPLVDLPFTESGMTPDIIINPHAFPSRMTIGMFVESMAAKAGALHGMAQDATPFKFSEEHTPVEYFGEQLRAAGYNYYGNEPMYSGITGGEMKADIYIGVVYYQRLRHMVSDKYQVRTTGPVHNLTQQPVKGRKRAGGIRFGEMERDSLLAHGVSFLLQDRLMNCSDYSQSYICRRCGSVLSPTILMPSFGAPAAQPGGNKARVSCHTCDRSDAIDVIAIPFVFRYLAAELMAMNIEIRLHVN